MNGTPVTLVGNVTDEPELRFTPGGAAVCKFSVAVNRRTYDRQTNEWKDAGTDFHRITAWRQLAENIAASLAKGSRVVVVGDLRQSSWVDEKTKEKRSGWDVQAEAVGAELTWATATTTRTKRQDGAPDDPWATGSRQRPAAAAGAQGGYDAEPPF
jgi:single-strand DNA-binding protein